MFTHRMFDHLEELIELDAKAYGYQEAERSAWKDGFMAGAWETIQASIGAMAGAQRTIEARGGRCETPEQAGLLFTGFLAGLGWGRASIFDRDGIQIILNELQRRVSARECRQRKAKERENGVRRRFKELAHPGCKKTRVYATIAKEFGFKDSRRVRQILSVPAQNAAVRPHGKPLPLWKRVQLT